MISRIYDQLQPIDNVIPLEDSDKAGLLWFQARNRIIVPYKVSLTEFSSIFSTPISILSLITPSEWIEAKLNPANNLISLTLLKPVPTEFYSNLFGTVTNQSYMDITTVNNLIYFTPQWYKYFAHVDSSIEQILDGLSGYRKKIDEDVFEWMSNYSFVVEIVDIDHRTYYRGKALSKTITADELVKLVDPNTSTITVEKISDELVKMTAPTSPSSVKPEDLNSVVAQDGNMTSKISGDKVAFLPNWAVPEGYTDTECAQEQKAIDDDFKQMSAQIDFIRIEIDGLLSGNSSVKQRRYDSLTINDDKTFYHGNISPTLYNTFAAVYNWGFYPETSYTLLPAPTATVEKNYEVFTVTADLAGRRYAIGRTYNIMQLGKTTGGMSPELQGLIIKAEDKEFDRYATIGLIVRQNRLIGSFDSTDASVPDAYKVLPNDTIYPIGINVMVQIGDEKYGLFGFRYQAYRNYTNTTELHCMFSEQSPLIGLKISNKNWYLSFPNEADLINLLPVYTYNQIPTKLSDCDGKVVFFSVFRMMKQFVDDLMNGKVTRDKDCSFRLRFNIADTEVESESSMSTCFDFEFPNVDFSTGEYFGSTHVTADEYIIIEVVCTYKASSQFLRWGGKDFELDAPNYEAKRRYIFDDFYAGGYGEIQGQTPTMNFVQNINSDMITRFNIADANEDGYNNKYLLKLFKLGLASNEFDVVFNFGDIDINGYSGNSNNFYAGTRVGFTNTVTGTMFNAPSLSPNSNLAIPQNVAINIHFTGRADYDRVPNITQYWGTWSIKVPTYPNSASDQYLNNTVDKIRVTYIDNTNNQKSNVLKFLILKGDDSYVVLANLQLVVAGLFPPYRVVFEWDSSRPDRAKLIDFSYTRKFT